MPRYDQSSRRNIKSLGVSGKKEKLILGLKQRLWADVSPTVADGSFTTQNFAEKVLMQGAAYSNKLSSLDYVEKGFMVIDRYF